MAFLMLLHEKMRLQRKVMKLTAKQALASSRKERVTKQIERVQKMYSKKEANLDAMAKRAQNSATMQFRNMFGCSSNNINLNPMGYMMGGSYNMNNTGVFNALAMAIQSGEAKLDKCTDINDVYNTLTQYRQVQGEDGKPKFVDAQGNDAPDGFAEKYQEANQLMNAASCQYQMNQSLCNNAISNYESNVSIWLEDQKAQLEAEQDMALEPLNEQELEWDLESQSAETQLADARARLDSIKQALSDGIKDSAPTFGLG